MNKANIRSKIRPNHLEFLRYRLSLVRAQLPAHRAKLENDPRVKDIEKRLRWDALNATVSPIWISENLYPYVNDEHIDNALKNLLEMRA